MSKKGKNKNKNKARSNEPKTSLPVQKRGYDAVGGGLRPLATASNVGPGFFASNPSADTELFGALRILRDRSRDLGRNNAHAASAMNSLVTSIIGEGITPRPTYSGPDGHDKNEKVKAAWNAWIKANSCDFSGRSDIYGFQTRAVRQMIEAGEVLIRRRIPDLEGRFTAPLELQLLEADFLDATRNTPVTVGTAIKQGVEIALVGKKQGKRVGYWLFPGPTHPGDYFYSAQQGIPSEHVDANNVLHMFEMQREQTRGCPWIAPSILTLQNLYDYEYAELERKKGEACTVAIVNTEDDYQVGINQIDEFGEFKKVAGCYDCHGNAVERLEPGMILYTSGGKTVEFNHPATIGGYSEYKVSVLKTAAAGMRLPYENLSGDVSQANYSSIRISQIIYRAFIRQVQYQIVIPQMLDPIWDWFCDAAWASDLIDDPVVPVEWSPPKLEWINPSDDVTAAIMAIQAGIKSYDEIVSEMGRDPHVVRAEIAEFQRNNRELYDIVLTTDPSAVTGRGVLQKSDPANPHSPSTSNDSGYERSAYFLSALETVLRRHGINKK